MTDANPTKTALAQFMEVFSDEERLALGVDTLRAALREARARHLIGWSNEVYEYVYALESGKGLNRPLVPRSDSSS